MNKNIAIIGAGQSSLLLGIALLKQGFFVSIISEKTAVEISSGSPTSSQGLFHTALKIEREMGLNEWDEIAPSLHS